MAKIKKLITLDADTIKRIESIQNELHLNSVSQTITFLVWDKSLKSENSTK